MRERRRARRESVSRCAAAAGIFTPVVLQMIAVGEETGDLDSLMVEVADMYERETDYAIKGLAASIEPLLLTGDRRDGAGAGAGHLPAAVEPGGRRTGSRGVAEQAAEAGFDKANPHPALKKWTSGVRYSFTFVINAHS